MGSNYRINKIILFILFYCPIFAQDLSLELFDIAYKELFEHNNYDKGVQIFKRSGELSLLEEDFNSYLYTQDYIIYAHILNNKNGKAKKLVESTFIDLNNYDNYHDKYLLADLYFLDGIIKYREGQNQESILSLKKSIESYNHSNSFSYRISNIYKYLGYNFLSIGDYENSIEYFDLSIVKDKIKENYILADILIAKAGCLTKSGSFKKAENALVKAGHYLEMEIENKDPFFYISLLEEKSRLAFHLGQYDKALRLLETQVKYNPKAHEIINQNQIRGRILSKMNNTEDSFKAFETAIYHCKNNLKINKFKLSETYLIMANAYAEQKNYKQAIIYIEQCIETLTKKIKINEIDLDRTINHRLLTEALLLYATTNYNLGNFQNFKQTGLKTLEVYNYLLKNKILSFESRLFYISKFRKNSEALINLANKIADKEFAFSISQNNHGKSISIDLYREKSMDEFNIPDSIINRELELKTSIFEYQSKLAQSISSEKSDSIKLDIYSTRQQLDRHFTYVESTYPIYHKLKYENPPELNICQIQNSLLDDSSALIEYFLSKKSIYIFTITKDTAHIFTKNIDDEFYQNIRGLNKSIRELNNTSFDLFTKFSQELYSILLSKSLSLFNSNINKLYIIPDNEINYIPFEVLLKEIPASAENNRYDLLPYLVKDYSISYHYSSALLNKGDTDLSNDLINYAPSFNSSDTTSANLEPLLHNQEEVLTINNIANGQIQLDTSANLRSFKASIAAYGVAHFATHANSNDTLPLESKIYFDDGPLHAYEIYNMPHNLDLAVLSACETGTGALKKGEGLMSLCRAFISSGCKSVITSLWNVNDRKSVDIMKSFYTNLFNGDSVGTSLTKSKRDYLANVNSVMDAHPYHWATFIAVGNADMAIPTYGNYLPLILGACLIMLIAFLTFIKFSSK